MNVLFPSDIETSSLDQIDQQTNVGIHKAMLLSWEKQDKRQYSEIKDRFQCMPSADVCFSLTKLVYSKSKSPVIFEFYFYSKDNLKRKLINARE